MSHSNKRTVLRMITDTDVMRARGWYSAFGLEDVPRDKEANYADYAD